MEEINIKQEEIRRRAERLIHRNEELINILDNWIPSEEANANMEREFVERRRREREIATACRPSTLNRLQRFLFEVRRGSTVKTEKNGH